MVNDKAVDNDVGGLGDHQACIPGDVDAGPSPVDGCVAAYEKRLVEKDVHVFLEGDPDFGLHHCGAVSECTWAWIYRVVARVGDLVAYEISSDVVGHFSNETHRANAQLLPVSPPVRVRSPASVNGVHLQPIAF